MSDGKKAVLVERDNKRPHLVTSDTGSRDGIGELALLKILGLSDTKYLKVPMKVDLGFEGQCYLVDILQALPRGLYFNFDEHGVAGAVNEYLETGVRVPLVYCHPTCMDEVRSALIDAGYEIAREYSAEEISEIFTKYRWDRDI